MNKQEQGKELFQKALDYYRRFAIDNPKAYQLEIETLERILDK
jgi:hypothetical protein